MPWIVKPTIAEKRILSEKERHEAMPLAAGHEDSLGVKANSANCLHLVVIAAVDGAAADIAVGTVGCLMVKLDLL